MCYGRVLLATIRNLGKCLCPRCKVTKDRVSEMGTKYDEKRRRTLARFDSTAFRNMVSRARDAIFRLGKGIKSTVVEALLGAESLVPTVVSFNPPFPETAC